MSIYQNVQQLLKQKCIVYIVCTYIHSAHKTYILCNSLWLLSITGITTVAYYIPRLHTYSNKSMCIHTCMLLMVHSHIQPQCHANCVSDIRTRYPKYIRTNTTDYIIINASHCETHDKLSACVLNTNLKRFRE